MRGEHIIIGGGIAGCSLAWQLSEAGENVLLLDAGDSASLISGGIINPLSGRKFALKANIHERSEALEDFYTSLIPYQSSPLKKNTLLFRTLGNQGETLQSLGELRKTEKGLDALIVDLLETPPAPEFIGGRGILMRTGQIDVYATLATIKKELERRGQYENHYLDLNSLRSTAHGMKIETWESQTLTLAQGWEASRTGAFSWLPFVPSKGERILVEFAQPLSRPEIHFKQYEILAPSCEREAFFGATFTWGETDTKATQEKRIYLEEKLKGMISTPFTVKKHDAHIRPASRDRKPFLGVHPEQKNLFVFNGLGALGFSLAPLYSRELMENMLEGKPIREEANIKRFARFYKHA